MEWMSFLPPSVIEGRKRQAELAALRGKTLGIAAKTIISPAELEVLARRLGFGDDMLDLALEFQRQAMKRRREYAVSKLRARRHKAVAPIRRTFKKAVGP